MRLRHQVPPERQERVRASLSHRLGGSPGEALTVKSVSNITRGVK
jgi:hypothetical protein